MRYSEGRNTGESLLSRPQSCLVIYLTTVVVVVITLIVMRMVNGRYVHVYYTCLESTLLLNP